MSDHLAQRYEPVRLELEARIEAAEEERHLAAVRIARGMASGFHEKNIGAGYRIMSSRTERIAEAKYLLSVLDEALAQDRAEARVYAAQAARHEPARAAVAQASSVRAQFVTLADAARTVMINHRFTPDASLEQVRELVDTVPPSEVDERGQVHGAVLAALQTRREATKFLERIDAEQPQPQIRKKRTA
jgi:hypothetical protein